MKATKLLLSVLCVLLCLTTVLSPSLAVGAFADGFEQDIIITPGEEDPDNPENPDLPDDPVNPDEPDLPQEPDNPQEPEEAEYVAKLCICARTRVFGHVWLYVENLTDGELKVGAYTLPQGQGVSIGTFFFSRSNGGGIYYNVEAYCGNATGLEKTESASMLITAEQLVIISKKTLKNNQWNPFINCGFFATNAWNAVSDIHIAYGVFPFITKSSIKRKGGEGVPQMYVPTAEQVFKQKGFNENATLKPATRGTLKHKIG